MSQESRGIALVTGASSGIGAATARALAAEGFHVVAAARRMDRLEALAAGNPNIEAHALDVTSQESVAALAQYLAGKPLSLVVSNAGGAFDSATVLTSDPAIWEKTYQVNVIGSLRVIQSLTPIMQAHGKGHIVLLTSTAGHGAYENGGSYTTAKSAEVVLAQTLRLELNGQNIRITEVAPGMVKTEEFSSVRFGGDAERAEKVYAGVDAPLTAEDVAETIRWATTLPSHVNIDSLIVRPVAQASNYKIHRKQ